MTIDIAILASGNGTNAQAIIDKINDKILDAKIALIVTNNPKAGVIDRAKKANIKYVVIDHTTYKNRSDYDNDLLNIVKKSNAKIIVLAGYMRLLDNQFLSYYKNCVLNIHPALLPSFTGMHAGEDAIKYGVKLSGCTVHFVEEEVDSGPVIIQAAVPIKDQNIDNLMQEIHKMEHRIYPQAIQWLSENRLKINDRYVILENSTKKLAIPPNNAFIYPPLEEGF